MVDINKYIRMHNYIDEWMNEWINELINEWMNKISNSLIIVYQLPLLKWKKENTLIIKLNIR